MLLSPQQQAVLSFADTQTGSLSLIARAGCGKSTTIIMLVEHLIKGNPNLNIFVGAYNKAIACELTQKLESKGIGWKQAEAKTMHAMGFRAWKKHCNWTAGQTDKAIDEKKVSKLFDAAYPAENTGNIPIRRYAHMITKCVSLAKQRALGVLGAIDDKSLWYDIIDHFGLDDDLPEDADEQLNMAVGVAIDLYKASLRTCQATIDFDDMILAPLYHKARFWQYNYVMIDEAQDTNPARRALAMKLMKPGGRFVAVGDPAQAIYGFTGADSDALELIGKAVNATTLPLNVTYRCPKSIVERAQRWVPDFVAHESAPDGIIREINLERAKDADPAKKPAVEDETFTAQDAILCRNTAALVTLAYKLLRRGVACRIEGRDIAKGIVQLCEKWELTNIDALLTKVAEWKEKEVSRWMAKEREQKAAECADRADTVIELGTQMLSEGKKTIAELTEFISSMFGDTPSGEQPKCLTLATIHRSKGREWKRVYILGQDKYQPSKYARKAWQISQETNLMYVATTRAMSELIDIVI
jgi:superfamily I DNA/RNA helicase